MKILWVLENYHPLIGGVETLFKRLQEQLCEQGHELTILTSRPDKTTPRKESGPHFEIIRVPFRNRYLFTFLAFPWVWWYARSAELVHTTSYNAAIPAFIGAKLRGKKVIITFHEAWGKLWFRLPFISKAAKYLHYAFEQVLLKLPFNRFIAVSQSTERRLYEEGVKARRIGMIYNGVDYGEFVDEQMGGFADEESRSFTFTYFGRLGISKGLDLLLPAAMALKKRRDNWKLQLIVPTYPANMLKIIKGYISQYDLQGHIYLRHHLSWEELKRAISQSDCVVIPSYSEGFCFAAVETMALGTPIISSGQGALAEVIGGKHLEMNSLDIPSLLIAMERAMAEEWEELPHKRFELHPQLKAYEALYEELIGE